MYKQSAEPAGFREMAGQYESNRSQNQKPSQQRINVLNSCMAVTRSMAYDAPTRLTPNSDSIIG